MAMLNESQMVDIPDRHGANVYDEDPGLQALLKIYLEQNLLTHLTPTFQDLGRAVGNELDELALVADKNPPVLQLRNRQGLDEQKVIKHPAFIALDVGFYRVVYSIRRKYCYEYPSKNKINAVSSRRDLAITSSRKIYRNLSS
ncbi:hypothetical protein MMG00_03015 [Ignatzschineria rhizosphaerae]|uniref:Adaptive response protein AidB N-terminal domain-containing protein n=1 Tax=Ignatzschineria rhizosphaerae TaxID=2923279 RepID=A0ABY3XA46_9GAMM|nr:hypothetical protein [Ignatzschineria rhizosphaerae]UNM96843.1 hypothetical protein MMG00_03015 [Ignatzschineria rhizosphaerae]